MKIIHFPHPTLRRPARALRRVDDALRSVFAEMFELMYEANGIGLAANQVDIPLRFFICNLSGRPDEGEEHVFLNPVISRPKGNEEREEGCLSLPGLYAPVRRPTAVHFQAYTLQGEVFEQTLDGLMARVVQHEVDHLDGTLFIDRLTEASQLDIRPTLDEFSLELQNLRHCGEIPDDAAIAANWKSWEDQYA